MKHIEFKTSKGEFIVIDMDTLFKDSIHQMLTNSINNFKGIVIGDNMYEELGSIADITEEQAKEVVDDYKCFITEDVGYQDYKSESYLYRSATLSLHSILEANGVVFENKHGEEPMLGYYVSPSFEPDYNEKKVSKFRADKARWQEAQSKVWNKPQTYLFKKI